MGTSKYKIIQKIQLFFKNTFLAIIFSELENIHLVLDFFLNVYKKENTKFYKMYEIYLLKNNSIRFYQITNNKISKYIINQISVDKYKLKCIKHIIKLASVISYSYKNMIRLKSELSYLRNIYKFNSH